MSTQQALVWQRSDFRESSRLVTLVTREGGKLTTLAKGAHRDQSPFLGRIDFLNLIEARMTRGSLPLLHRVKLIHEPRGLRQPERYLRASYLVELFDPAFPQGRGDPDLFDMLVGGLRLLERCPPAALPQVVLGIEVRFLQTLGLLPPLRSCSRCGETRGPLVTVGPEPALLCARHRNVPGQVPSPAIPAAALAWLADSARRPGRELPSLAPAPAAARRLLGHWVTLAVERPLRLRPRALARARSPKPADIGTTACQVGDQPLS